jgi:hypothetical protein
MKIIIKSPKAAIVKNIQKLTKYIASDKDNKAGNPKTIAGIILQLYNV